MPLLGHWSLSFCFLLATLLVCFKLGVTVATFASRRTRHASKNLRHNRFCVTRLSHRLPWIGVSEENKVLHHLGLGGLPLELGAHDPLLVEGVGVALHQLGHVGVRGLGGQAPVGVHVT